jgi:predicted aspartyl protease
MKASLSLSPRVLISVALAGVVALSLLAVWFVPIHSIMATGRWNVYKPTGDLPAFDDLPEFVEMKKIDKVYHVRVSINDSLYFDAIVDSGASDLVIPNDIVRTLMRAEFIKQSDFIGSRTTRVADGREIPSQEFRVRSLRLGDTVIGDVVASTVSENAKSILLGQSVLSRFKTVTIDNERSALLLSR